MKPNPTSSIGRQQGKARPLPLPAMLLGLSFLLLGAALSCPAGDLDTMGVTLLRGMDSTLTGSGISVAQAEAQDVGTNDWEMDPPYVGQPVSLFTWINTNGSATNFPNTLGTLSGHGHASNVAYDFYGSAAGVAPGVLHVDNYEADYFIAYDVDTGVGISPENLPRVFEAYFTTKKGGTGLGLPTTRRIIEEHGGHITVQSEPGKGTSFRVELPLAGA